MRVTVDIDEAHLQALNALCSASGEALSIVLNDVLARGLSVEQRTRTPFVQRTFPMDELVDVTNVGALMDRLDGPEHTH